MPSIESLLPDLYVYFPLFSWLFLFSIYLVQHLLCFSWYINFLSCCNKLLQIWYLKTTEIHSLTVLEARNLNSRCQKVMLPLTFPGRILPCFFLASGGTQKSLAVLTFICITFISVSVFSWPCVYVFVFSPFSY